MRINVELSAQEIAALRQLTKLEDDGEAVTKAVREYLRFRRLRELKSLPGQVEFEFNWRELEALELGESDFPQ